MDFFLVKKETIDFQNLSKKIDIISFHRDVLSKYENDNDFNIELDQNVGVIRKNNEWSLQIDVQENHVTTLLYKLGGIPSSEREHFQKHNIFPRELSSVAHRRWVLGTP